MRLNSTGRDIMKIRLRALVGSVALAIGGVAQAAIDADNTVGTDTGGVPSGPGNGNGGGELFLSVVDRGATLPMSYVLNLGITADQFIANDASYLNSLSFAADSNLQTLLANPGGTVAWNIAAAHNEYGPTNDELGYLSTAPEPVVANDQTVQGIGGLEGALTKIGSYLLTVNLAMEANNSLLITDPSSRAYHDYEGYWGNTWHTSLHSTEGDLDESLGFYYVATDLTGDPSGNSSRVVPFLGQWTLAANGMLTYAVPIPGAVWLLGSALLGMMGVVRRRGIQDVDIQRMAA